MSTSPKAVIVTDIGSNKIVACNSKWNQLCGYEPEEAFSTTPKVLQGEGTSMHKAGEFAARVAATGVASVKLINYTKLGRAFVHCLRSCRITDPDTGTAYYFTESYEETDAAIQKAMLKRNHVDDDEAESESPTRDGAIFIAFVLIVFSILVLPVLQEATVPFVR